MGTTIEFFKDDEDVIMQRTISIEVAGEEDYGRRIDAINKEIESLENEKAELEAAVNDIRGAADISFPGSVTRREIQ